MLPSHHTTGWNGFIDWQGIFISDDLGASPKQTKSVSNRITAKNISKTERKSYIFPVDTLLCNMKKYILCLALGFYSLVSCAQEDRHFFININGTLGNHTIVFKDFADSKGLSFGYAVNLGIYAVHKSKYRGGLSFGLLEAASRDENRRMLSEDFVLPNPSFDKHIIFKFAQFRSGNIGWFSEYDFSEKLTFYHQTGFGIFGTTEKDQLLDFAMNQQAGLFVGSKKGFRGRFGINFDTTFGTGNPNYLQRNIGISFGGTRSF